MRRFKGELIYKYGDMLHGVYSARMYLKQLNARCETLLEKYAEPLSVIAWAHCGMEYPDGLLHYAWKTLLRNHPHDDICGCSIDTVHREMENRFGTVIQVGEALAIDALRAVGNRVQREASQGIPFVVFNPLPWKRTELVTGTITLDATNEPWDTFVVRDHTGSEIGCTVAEQAERRTMEVLRGWHLREFQVQFTAQDVPALGYKTFFVTNGRPSRSGQRPSGASDTGFENEFYRLDIASNGTLRLRDKRSRVTYSDLLQFEDVADAGDEYNFSPLPGTKIVRSTKARANVSVQRKGTNFVTYLVKLKLKLPRALSADRSRRVRAEVTLPIESAITCSTYSPRIDVVTRLTNAAKDHRLRVLFPTPIQTAEVDVEEHFDVVRRSVKLPPPKGELPPYPTQHQKSFVDLTDGQRGFAVLNRGLPEFEIVPGKGGNTIAVTLLRCVGWLSRPDLRTRKGNAGPECETPEAQCLGPHTFEYSIVPHAGNWVKGEVMRRAHEVNAPLWLTRAEVSPSCLAPGPNRKAAKRGFEERVTRKSAAALSFMKLRPDYVVLSALKKARTGAGMVVRVYNPTTTRANVCIAMHTPIKRANLLNLNEEPKAWLHVTSTGTVEFPCGPREILTVELFC
jgi:mannosylglycerate hydrolase